MLKTKKRILLIALLSAIAMLCCGMALLFTPTSVVNTTSTNITVKALGTLIEGTGVYWKVETDGQDEDGNDNITILKHIFWRVTQEVKGAPC